MMRRLMILLAVLISASAFTQNEVKRELYKGNIFYENGEFEDALFYYLQAVENGPLHYKANYNLGNAYFHSEDNEKAIGQFEKVKDLAPTNKDKAWVYHNLGNAYLRNQKVDDAIEAYKNALRLVPTDEQTRYNLAYAQQMKKEQDKQDQEQQENEDQQDQNQNQDDSENQDQQNKDQQQDDNKDQSDSKDEKDEKPNEGEDKNNDNGDQKDNKDGQNGQPKYEPITKEQARRILEAASRKEKKLQEELDQKKKVGTGEPRKIDW